MICSACNGSGIAPIPHVPGSKGGWMDRQYIHSDMPCGACGGSGRVSGDADFRASQISSVYARVAAVDVATQTVTLEVVRSMQVGTLYQFAGPPELPFFPLSFRYFGMDTKHASAGTTVTAQVAKLPRVGDRVVFKAGL